MAKRRDPGDGSIYYNTAKARWEGSVSVGSGPKRKRRTVSSRAGRADVRARLEALKAEPGLAATIDPRTSVADLAAVCLERKRLQVRSTSFDNYSKHFVHITRDLGDKRLCDVTQEDIRLFYAALKLAPVTVRSVRVQLVAMFEVAMKAGAIPENPARVKSPKVSGADIRPFDEMDAARLLKAVAGQKYEAAFGLGMIRGMRRGEILGLRWPYVDFENSRIEIAWSLQVLHVNGSRPLALTEVKTDSSRRTIEMTRQVREMLLARRERQRQERILAGRRWQGDDRELVFTTRSGRPVRPCSLNETFGRLQTTAKIQIRRRVHDLRHTCAALMLQARESPNVVSKLLGHKSVAFTLSVYGHLIPGMEAEASQRLEDRIFSRMAV